MALTKMNTDLNIIAALDDEPNSVGGLSAAELKAKFDESGNAIKTYINETLTAETDAHIDNTDNPHTVTAAQVGLGNCDNTADIDKPVSTPQQEALNLKANSDNVLEKNNVAEYNPTANYHPATKKYVDDTVGQAVLGAIPDGTITEVKLDASLTAKINRNRNLLDNWYFANPVDQRGGYVVPPGVTYYSLSDSSVAGQTDGYVKVDAISTDGYENAIITISETGYYVKKGNYVRGYTGTGYGIDRWILECNSSANLAVELHEDYIRLVQTSVTETNRWQTIYQKMGDTAKTIAGRVITVSLLHRGTGKTQLYLTKQNTPNAFANKIFMNASDWQISTLTATVPDDATDVWVRIYADITGSLGYTDVMAVKLELGTQQTLAHQDENGNWVLNDPPPDKNMELLKCCMSTADPNDTYANNNKTPASIGAVASTQGTATLPAAASWISNSAAGQRAYYVDIAVEPLTADNDIFIDRAYTVDKASDDAYAAAFSCVSTWVQSAGTLRAYAETPPESACPMNWTVIDG